MTSDVLEAKAAAEKLQKDLEAQKAKWPEVLRVARALSDLFEENHFASRLRNAQEGRSEYH